VPLEVLGVHCWPDMFSLASAHQAFDDAGAIRDAALAKLLDRMVERWVDELRRLG
jgi:hypothetical protein